MDEMDELDTAEFIAVNLEHAQWTNVVAEFRRLDMDVNDRKHDPLIRAIELWGERLVALRRSQDDSVTRRALSEHVVSYREACESRGPQ